MTVYGVNLLMSGMAYFLLQHFMARVPGQGERMREVFGRTVKEYASIGWYVLGIALAFVAPWLGLVPFAIVAITWLVPDRRVERYLESQGELLRD